VEVVGILHDPYIVEDVDDPIGKLKDPSNLILSVGALLRRFHEKKSWENFALHFPTKHADTIIAINDDEKRYIQKYYGRDAVRIYWCTPVATAPAVRPPELATDIAPGTFLLFIGQIKRRKGWDTVIDALASLRAREIERKLVFVTPLANVNVPHTYAEKKGVLDLITFLTSISNEEKTWLYENCRYVLVPSTYEGFGLPVFEAFLAKKPVCATDIPVFREFLQHKKNAMLSPTGDSNMLAESVIELDERPRLARNLVESGAQTAAQLNAERMVADFKQLIDT
jgi:glycosyltransferase involved in cell wall biosynthesis